MDKRTIIRAASLIVAMIATVCVIIPAATGALQCLIVLSGSMNPIMQPGDMVVVKTITPKDVRVGDIIAYHDPGGAENVIVTHRAMQVEKDGGTINIHTKGDANEDFDTYTVSQDDVIGEMVFVLPYLGYAVERSKKQMTFIVLVVLPSLLIVVDELRKIAMYSNPVLARKTDRANKKEKKRRTLTTVNYTRLSIIMLAGTFVFGALFIPYLTGCGYTEVSGTQRIENFESLSSVFVFNPANGAGSVQERKESKILNPCRASLSSTRLTGQAQQCFRIM
jgi:signal peptidase